MKSVFENRTLMRTVRVTFQNCLLLMALVMLLTSCGSSTGTTWQEQYDLGIQYLTDGDYEAAIAAFTAAIETEPKRASLYIARGNAYLSWAQKLETDAAATVESGEFVEWEEISSTDNGYTLQNLYENAQSDYEEAAALLESGEAADQADDLLEEVRQKLEEIKDKQQDGREVLAAKLVELAEEILNRDTSEEEKELAYQRLEEAEKLTEDEDVLRQIEEMWSEEGDSDYEEQSGDDAGTQLEASSSVENGEASGRSSGYQNLEDFSAEEQTVIADLVTAAVNHDLDSVYLDLQEFTEAEWYTMYDDYRVRITRGRDYNGFNIGEGEEWWPYIIVSVMPQNGTGYCYYVWEDADGSSNLLVGFYSYFRITDYVTCPCVNWNWNGEYTQIYNLYYDDGMETGTSTGTVKNNIHDGEVSLTYEIIWDGEVESSETYTFYYENGSRTRSLDKEGRSISDPRFYSWQYNGVTCDYWLNDLED